MQGIADLPARIAASLDYWKRRLLDLSLRNRGLNFRVNKVSTVAVVDEQPPEVFHKMVLADESMRFLPVAHGDASGPRPTAQASTTDANASEEELLLGTPEEDAPSLAFEPYDPAQLDERHTDNSLQTTATAEQLDRSLRRLDDLARSSIDEQGVHTLFLTLGMLEYTQSSESETVLRAPLILLPVELSRRSARSGYTLSASDDPFVNPALNEYLRRFQGGLSLPELPDPAVIADDYDLQEFFRETSARIADHVRWQVKRDIYLGTFAFQKLVMFKDLEANAKQFGDHPLVRQLVARDGSYTGHLPADIEALELDRDYPPEASFQVVDADASQLRAIASVSRGYHLVLEGPPGTGKSQTITNLIARALSDGRSVLFVAEKMAALQVVANRLDRAGLGEFCLELHSGKANKRQVMQQIASALERSLQRTAVSPAATGRLPTVRNDLSVYVQAVHTPWGALAESPYIVLGSLAGLVDRPRLRFTGSVRDITRDQLASVTRDLQDLAGVASAVGDPRSHPWRDSTKLFYSPVDIDDLSELLGDLRRLIAAVREQSAKVDRLFHMPTIGRLVDVVTATTLAGVIRRSPGAPLAVLSSEAWNTPPRTATTLLEDGRALSKLRLRVTQRFTAAVLEQEHAQDIAFIEQKSKGIAGWFAILDGRFRAIKKRWGTYRLPSYTGSLAEQAVDLETVDRYRNERAALKSRSGLAQELFGSLWQGEGSDWDSLDRYVNWVVAFRAVCVQHHLQGQVLETASRPTPDVSAIDRLAEMATKLNAGLGDLSSRAGWPTGYFTDQPLEEIAGRLEALADGIGMAVRWATFEHVRSRVAGGLGADALQAGMRVELPFSELASAFQRGFYERWLSVAVEERGPLRAFVTMSHEARQREFQALDQAVLFENQALLVAQLRQQVQARLQDPAVAQAMPALRAQLARQRGLSPLRLTMRRAAPAIRAIKPCFLMSPLTVSQLLSEGTPSFDLVVFDEASQLPTEDAIGAIARGGQLVVVGDPKQLPPTNFFAITGGQSNVPLDSDGLPIVEDSESILEEFMAAGAPQCRLKWHYRSAHESLITFSNVSFYDGDLYTFPSVGLGEDGLGLSFVYVPDGVYEGKGLNLVEARRVADAVVQHAKSSPHLTLGVGTFNLRQQIAIQDELERRRREDPTLDSFFAGSGREPVFIKNLENIQGDERDVIFLSVTYARNRDGQIRYNFGPLNGENGWRRLNVLVTRARRQMTVFASMRGDDINPATTSSPGPRLLRDFLLYAERGTLAGSVASAGGQTESPLELAIYNELTRAGLTLHPQVGVGRYRIDFGIVDPALPGRYLCGLECDGVSYHAAETARDRDRLRQQVLEGRGWTIHRIWSTDWFKDQAGQVARILSLVEDSRRRAREEREAEEEARKVGTERDLKESQAREASLAQMRAETEAGSRTEPVAYERPVASEYVLTSGTGRSGGTDILEVPLSNVVEAVVEVVRTEGPLHEIDVRGRIAGFWGTRLGSRVEARIDQAVRRASEVGLVVRQGEFLRHLSNAAHVRSRAGLRIPPERIPPDEYRDAVRLVLRGGHSFPADELAQEVRAVLGFGRLSAPMDERIRLALEFLRSAGEVGEGPLGFKLLSDR